MKPSNYFMLIAISLLSCLVSVRAQKISTIAGNRGSTYNGDGGPATLAALNTPVGLVFDAYGNLFIADAYNNRVRKISREGIITTVAGNGVQGTTGDGSFAVYARLNAPNGLAIDSSGNLLIVDWLNNRVRKVSKDGLITNIAGTGIGGYGGDGGLANAAQLTMPVGITQDAAGNIYIADFGNHRVRKISHGIITTIAGTGVAGYSGDGGTANAAKLNYPAALAFDKSGNLYIAEQGNSIVRKISPDNIISTYAGTGVAGYSGDGGPATAAKLDTCDGLAIDGAGNLFITDLGNSRIRKVSPTGIISTIAGNGVAGYNGDGDVATSTQINHPDGITTDVYGNVYISDRDNNLIRKISYKEILAPVIDSFLPGIGSTGSLVTIKGRNFTTVKIVNFGNIPANSFTVVNDSIIKAVVGAGESGRVSVTGFGGTAMLPGFVFCLNVTPSITIAANPNGSICAGTNVIFTATAVNGGTTPVFIWRKNNLIVGNNSKVYKDSLLTDKDSIWVTMISNALCATKPVVNSKKVIIAVAHDKPASPSEIVGPAAVKKGAKNVVFKITKVPGLAYMWTVSIGDSIKAGQGKESIKVNWGKVPGIVSVNAQNACGTSAGVSKTVGVTSLVAAGETHNSLLGGKPVIFDAILFPNPTTNNSILRVIGATGDVNVSITDMSGRLVWSQKVQGFTDGYELPMANYSAGIYIITVTDGVKIKTIKLIKQ